jgi:hypothetical protein
MAKDQLTPFYDIDKNMEEWRRWAELRNRPKRPRLVE